MGRKNRERIRAGLEQPIARRAVALASRQGVIDTLRAASTEDQIDALNRTAATTKPDKLRRAIEDKSPHEMDKAIVRLLKEGRPVTVDALCAEVRSTPGFLLMCEGIGLSLDWFENLAQKRMRVYGL